MKRTPLYNEMVNAGGKMVDFVGWEMPVRFSSLKDEHLQVRKSVGLFDVSHMGEIFVRGPKSYEALQWLTSNDVAKLDNGKAQYSLLTNENGGIVDDVIIYCIKNKEEYLVCVNASNIFKDYQWMQANSKGAEIVNESSSWAQIAIQGPNSMKTLAKVLGQEVADTPNFKFKSIQYNSEKCIVGKSGYTGELGAEVFIPNNNAVSMWQKLMEAGKEFGIKAIGLGARDTLRTEMKYSLYGHEIDDTTNPLEAGLGFVVKLEKGDFMGRAAIVAAKEAGLKNKLVGFELTDKGIPRQGYNLFNSENTKIGIVTSGTMSPSLGKSIGIGYVNSEFSEIGNEILVDIRNRKARAQIVKCPFVNK